MVLFTSDRYNTGKISFGHDWIPSFAMYSFVSAIRDNRAGCWPHALIPLNPLVIWHSLAGSEVNRCNDSIIRVVTFLYRRIGNEKATVYFQSIARKYRISNNLSQGTKKNRTGKFYLIEEKMAKSISYCNSSLKIWKNYFFQKNFKFLVVKVPVKSKCTVWCFWSVSAPREHRVYFSLESKTLLPCGHLRQPDVFWRCVLPERFR